jgi:hypothetical protein
MLTVTTIFGFLFQVKYRVSWIKHQEAKRRREEEEAERERVSYAQVKISL